MASFHDAIFGDYAMSVLMQHHGEPDRVTYQELGSDKQPILELSFFATQSAVEKSELVQDGHIVRRERMHLKCDREQDGPWQGTDDPQLHGQVIIDGVTWQVDPDESLGVHIAGSFVTIYLMRWLTMHSGLVGTFDR